MIESDEYVTNTPPPWAATLFEALHRCTPAQADKRRVVLPYCVQTMDGLPERAVLLNRWYKPLGVVPARAACWDEYERVTRIVDCGVVYEDFPESHVHIELYKLLRLTLIGGAYFFNDGNSPWHSAQHLHAYRERIKGLVSPWINAAQWEA